MNVEISPGPPPTMDELAADGWQSFEDKGFIGLIGPIVFRNREGTTYCGFVAGDKHENRNGVIHGGMLAAFSDRALGTAVRQARPGIRTATIELSMHYVSSVDIGEFVEMECEIIRMTRSIAFMRGTLSVGSRIVATAEGVWKITVPNETA
jgi:acyl-coenzyme A thioesterase PaaI-like protein